MFDYAHVFTFLFLMIGPFKIVAPYAKITKNADPRLARRIALVGIAYSCMALLLAIFLGERILGNFKIPIPILGMSGGIILFLVALLNVIKEFEMKSHSEEETVEPSLSMAMYPLAFPTIVTPYGIAAVIIFVALAPDLNSRLAIGAIILGIMICNLVIMLVNKYIFKYLAMILPVLGAVLGVVQVALGLLVMFNAWKQIAQL